MLFWILIFCLLFALFVHFNNKNYSDSSAEIAKIGASMMKDGVYYESTGSGLPSYPNETPTYTFCEKDIKRLSKWAREAKNPNLARDLQSEFNIRRRMYASQQR